MKKKHEENLDAGLRKEKKGICLIKIIQELIIEESFGKCSVKYFALFSDTP